MEKIKMCSRGCGNPVENQNQSYCRACQREYARTYYEATRVPRGGCLQCGKPLDRRSKGHRECRACRVKRVLALFGAGEERKRYAVAYRAANRDRLNREARARYAALKQEVAGFAEAAGVSPAIYIDRLRRKRRERLALARSIREAGLVESQE